MGACSLRQLRVRVLSALLLLLTAAPGHAADCASLGDPANRANFRFVGARSDLAYESQRAINAAYLNARLDIDGIVGNNTAAWLKEFCKDINLTAADDLPGKLIAALQEFKKIADQRTDPEPEGTQRWRNTLNSTAFKEWFGQRPEGAYGNYFNYTSGTAPVPGGMFLLADFESDMESARKRADRKAAEAEPPLSGLFVLNEEDFETLKAESAVFESLTGLLGLSAASKPGLRAQIVENLGLDDQQSRALVDQLVASAERVTTFGLRDQAVAQLQVAGVPSELLDAVAALQQLARETKEGVEADVNQILTDLATTYRGRIADVEASVKAAANDSSATPSGQPADASPAPATAAPTADQLRASLREKNLPEALVRDLIPLRSSSSRIVVNRLIAKYRTQITDNIEQFEAYTVTDATLTDPKVLALSETIPELVLEDLAALAGVQFPDGELFRTAVRLNTGLGDENKLAINAILRIARKREREPAENELQLAPIQWLGGDCGCGIFESIDGETPSHLYGMYPYWQAPQAGNASVERDPETIDFSMLERIGYYGVTFDSTGRIERPLHFKQEEEPGDGWFRQRRNYAQFVKSAHKYKTKVDLVVYNAQWQQWLPEREGGESRGQRIDPGQAVDQLIDSIGSVLTVPLDGAINRIKPLISLRQSPARTVGDGVTFDFDFRALDEVEQQWLFDELLGADFFAELKRRLLAHDGSEKYGVSYKTNIIVPAACLTGEGSQSRCAYYSLDNLQEIEPHINLFLVDLTTRRPGSDILDEMKKVHQRIETAETEKHIELLRKVVPLVLPQFEEAEADGRLMYSDWHFSGIGTWKLNIDESVRAALRSVFFGVAADNILSKAESTVCNFACPYRWILRVLIFAIVLVSAVYVLASMWLFKLQALYSKPIFTWGVVAVAAIFVITLWCDPFWATQKSLIMFLTLLGSLLAWFISQKQKDRRRFYP